MRGLFRSAAIPLALGAASIAGATAAFAYTASSWHPVNECAYFTIGGCPITSVAGPTRVSADDGGCAGSVGLQVKTATTTKAAVFAATSVTISGSGMTGYRVWH